MKNVTWKKWEAKKDSLFFLKKQKKRKQPKKKFFVASSVFCPKYQNLKMNRTRCRAICFFFVTTANELFNPGLAMFHVASRNETNSKKEKTNVCYSFFLAILKVDTQKGKLIFVAVTKKQLWYRYPFFDTFPFESDISTVTKKESDTDTLEDDTLNGFLNKITVSI